MVNKVDLFEPPEKMTWSFCCAVTQGVMVAQQCHFRGGAELHQGAKSLNRQVRCRKAHLPVLSSTVGQPEKAGKKWKNEKGERPGEQLLM